MVLRAAFAVGLVLAGQSSAIAKDKIHKDFVHLRDVAPSIVQEMRYYGSHNFVGRKVDGYKAPECILTRRAAQQLKKVQIDLNRRGLSLKVYDCYRPKRAVFHFVRWAKQLEDKITKREFYPTLKKSRLFALKYISSRSEHSRGSTVDLTIVPIGSDAQSLDLPRASLVPCHFGKAKRYQDNSLDMGTGYDCFHSLSHTRNPKIKGEARKNRDLLVTAMARAGFRNYSREWWHFTLRKEPFRRTRFDFPVIARTGSGSGSGALKPETSPTTRQTQTAQGDGQDALPVDDGPALKVVCTGSAGIVELRETKSVASEVVATLIDGQEGLVQLSCVGKRDAAAWWKLDKIARKLEKAPLCKVAVYYSADRKNQQPDVVGWTSAKHLAPASASALSCSK